MKDNVLILTTGSSGSSVLAGIIATQGYWTGNETKKLNFDTFENAELVDLNMEILAASSFKRHDCNDLPQPSIKAIKQLTTHIDLKPFNNFIEKCSRHQPWLWKDPRLSFTIHFWAQIMEINSYKYILMDRDPIQSYTGLILNRKVPMSFTEQSRINQNYIKSCKLFFQDQDKDLPYFRCTFEDLIINPVNLLQRLNTFLDTNMDLQNVKSVYRGDLYYKRYSKLDFLKAKAQYAYWRYFIKDFVTFPRE